MMFQKLVMEDGIVEVTDISEKQESKSRPSGLNTVNLLKVRMEGVSIMFFPQFLQLFLIPHSSLLLSLFGFVKSLTLVTAPVHMLCVLAF